MPQSYSADSSENLHNSEQKLRLRVALDKSGNPILPSLVKRTLRSYAFVDLTMDLRDEALLASAVPGEELQAIADTQKLAMDVVVYAAAGEGLALGAADLEQNLRKLL